MKNYFTLFFAAVITFHLSSWTMDSEPSLPVLTESMSDEEWLEFARIGGGYYPIPEYLKEYIPETLKLAFEMEDLREHAHYIYDKKNEYEYLYSNENYWTLHPQCAQKLAKGMKEVAVLILNNVLRATKIDKRLYSQITGGLSDNKGDCFLKIMHYNVDKPNAGLSWHKDTRWITVLIFTSKGLEAQIDNKTISVLPRPGFFFINLGIWFEAFINDTNLVKAIVHQVRDVEENRATIGVFCEGLYPDSGFYQRDHEGMKFLPLEKMHPFSKLP